MPVVVHFIQQLKLSIAFAWLQGQGLAVQSVEYCRSSQLLSSLLLLKDTTDSASFTTSAGRLFQSLTTRMLYDWLLT